MKNIFKFSLVCLCTVLALAGCSEAEDGLVKVTYYANFSLNDYDDGITLVPIGSTYKDAGCVCTEGTEDISSKVVTTGADKIDTSKPGIYTVTYSATNVDGFASSASRSVAVYDESSIERNIGKTYSVSDETYLLSKKSGAKVPFSGYEIQLDYVAPGLYYVSDFLGGFYDQSKGYGSDYAMHGYLWLKNDNSIEALSTLVNGWGDSADDVRGTYDEATGTIKLEVDYAGQMTFYVTLK